MTAREIQQRIIADRYTRTLVIPNHTPARWWECDVAELTPAGFFREYEVKVDRSDFKADAAKARTAYSPTTQQWAHESKHAQLAIGAQNGPSQFWFVTPQGLVTVEEVPQWAGLIEAVCQKTHREPYRVRLTLTKPAPRLHNVKADPKTRERMLRGAYFRFASIFLFKSSIPSAELADPTT